jgi:hypothetical protein
MRVWRKNTSSSAKLVLAMTCRMNSGTASCRLTPMRVATSCPMSALRAESLRPKRNSSSETDRSHSTVSVTLPAPSAFRL